MSSVTDMQRHAVRYRGQRCIVEVMDRSSVGRLQFEGEGQFLPEKYGFVFFSHYCSKVMASTSMLRWWRYACQFATPLSHSTTFRRQVPPLRRYRWSLQLFASCWWGVLSLLICWYWCNTIPLSRGAICSDVGTACPLKGNVASANCHASLTSFNGTHCVAPVDVECAIIRASAWGCVFPASSTTLEYGEAEADTTYQDTVGGVKAGDYSISTAVSNKDDSKKDGSSTSSLHAVASARDFEHDFEALDTASSGRRDSNVYICNAVAKGPIGRDRSTNVEQLKASVPTECWYFGINCPL